MNYDSTWKKVDELINQKGLPQSALLEVNKIYAAAKKDKNQAQFIKALIYQTQLSQNEDVTLEIKKMETEADGLPSPAKQVAYAFTADLYWQYFQNNRWSLYGRTNTTAFNKEDIATWTTDDLHKKIGELYLASLENKTALQQVTLKDYDPIIIRGNMRALRPTLFDLLGHKALDYFQNDERDISQPAYAFVINENAAFMPAADFAKHAFVTRDTISLQYRALLVFQQLISFHLSDKSPEALLDVDLKRLSFVYNKAVQADKPTLYITALENIITQYASNSGAAQANYLLANYHFSLKPPTEYEEYEDYVNNGMPDNTHADALKTAIDICNKVIKEYPRSEGAANCINLRNNILRKSLSLQTEKVNIPGENFRTLVKYRNINNIHFTVAKITREQKLDLQNKYENSYWTKLVKFPAIRHWEQKLPPADDHRDHAAEVKIDGLPAGEYVLIASLNKHYGSAENLLAAQFFHVSNISYVNSNDHYFALHRKTGKPLSAATIQVWSSKYDYDDRKNVLKKAEQLKADKNGFFVLHPTTKDTRNIQLDISWQGDRLFLDDYRYLYARYNDIDKDYAKDAYEKDNRRVFFFTDRAIYRPGQTIHFKGIVVTKSFDTKKSIVAASAKVLVHLYDANYQKIDSAELVTNDYGSITGSFSLPKHLLTGHFSLTAEGISGETSFSVEEYKRPKFFTEISAPQESFRINDTVSVTGFAKAYAGNLIDGAKVSYRVYRNVRFPQPWWFYRVALPRTSRMEITNGETTTDNEGKFTIRFAAIPDLSISAELDPIFHYTVEADVTDINGETRSSSATVPVGYKSLVLAIESLEQPSPTEDFKSFEIYSKNLSDMPQAASITVQVSPLQGPGRPIRARYWKQPDRFVYTAEEYTKLFPFDEYKNERSHLNWKKGAAVFTSTIESKGDTSVSTIGTSWKPGWYVLEASAKDKDGGEVKTTAYVQLYERNAKTIPMEEFSWSTTLKDRVEPGETASFITGTSLKDVFLVQEKTVGQDDDAPAKSDFSFLTLNGSQTFNYPVTEDNRGGFGISQFFVQQNRVYSQSHNITVPWSNKTLDVRFSTFRDKTAPGSEEKWQVAIKGPKGEKLAAEMLATMYDASLDQFKPHYWSLPYVWPGYYNRSYWRGEESFASVSSNDYNTIPVKHQPFEKRYDQFLAIRSLSGLVGSSMNMRYRGMPQMDLAKRESAMDEVVLSEKEELKVAKFTQPELYNSADIVAPAPPPSPPPTEKEETTNSSSPIRSNFNETAFFFPTLNTDTAGNINFSFTMPEALTQWKTMAMAHTRELSFGYAHTVTVTQKELMVQPNAPRFLREKDTMAFSAKIVNLSEQVMNGYAKLELFDAATMQSVDHLFNNAVQAKSFSATAGQSTAVNFQLVIPGNFQSTLLYRISASSGNTEGKQLSDGEENILPVLTNQMLVTEALPINMRTAGTQQFAFEKLLQSGKSNSLQQYGLTVEYTANPAWYAIQSLPYLTDYPYECAEQTFNRYYANMLASTIANSSPRIKAIVEQWQKEATDEKSLESALQKNEELKSVLLEETPWLAEAKNETEQKKKIALLFDMVRMSQESVSSFKKLSEMQTSNGGFTWFKGGRDDRYITQYILSGIGHLQKLKVSTPASIQPDWDVIIEKGLQYSDKRINEDYTELVRKKIKPDQNHLTSVAIQYLYMRSFFPDKKIGPANNTAVRFYQDQAKKYWLSQSRYMQGLIALSLHRSGDKETSKKILASLKENALQHGDLGMYWKDVRRGYYWYQAPVETQALLIEAFLEITADTKAVNDMKIWLLKQKQTQNWGNTKATAEACYALLLQGTNWLTESPAVTINLGDRQFASSEADAAGTGYFKYKVDGKEVSPTMGNIKVSVQQTGKNTSGSWGAVYWQYFEDMDKITAAEEALPLQLKKEIFVERKSDRGPILEPVGNTTLQVGDKLKVRIELRVDRDMEYVHMKDTRAAGSEPVNVLSSYKWQGGLGYYEATKDAATNFFFDQLYKGTYVFEYPLFITHTGNFSVGIATIQCMYAPEFISHSEGRRIEVK